MAILHRFGKFAFSVSLLVTLSHPFSAYGAAPESKAKVAVMPIENATSKIDNNLIKKATSYLRGGIAASNDYVVVTDGRQDEKLKEMIQQRKKESYKDCYDESCQIEVGKALAADTIVRTKISHFETCILKVEMIDLAKEASVTATQDDFNCNPSGLKTTIDTALDKFGGNLAKRERDWGRKISGKAPEWNPKATNKKMVEFRSEPSAAAVYTDGQISCEKTPCSKNLSKGEHKISMHKEDYQSTTKHIDITEDRTLKWALEPKFSLLTVLSSGADVRIRVDERILEKTPIRDLQVPSGRHKVLVDSQCYKTSGQEVKLKRGQHKTLEFNPQPVPSAIKVLAESPEGNAVEATVFIGDRKLGETPGTWRVPVCTSEIRLEAEGFFTTKKKLELKDKETKTLTVQMKAQEKWEEVTVGRSHSCGITTTGTTKCWGDNLDGQLNIPKEDFEQIDAAGDHTCAVTEAGEIRCWGDSDHSVPAEVEGSFTYVSTGTENTCGVTNSGAVKCWGWFRLPQSKIKKGNFDKVTVGDGFACAKEEGKVKCWCWRMKDSYCNETLSLEQIDAGSYHYCALKDSGRAMCRGSTAIAGSSRLEPPSGTFEQISAGGVLSCGIRSSGSIDCWGRKKPGFMAPDANLKNIPKGDFRKVSVGDSHVCAITKSKTIKCWGADTSNQLQPPKPAN
jgi:alpha-tubulin suppressor-like RCC1 family protein